MTVVAVATRSGAIECEHHGHVAVVGPTGDLQYSAGDPQLITYPRSANKLFQAAAMRSCGLRLPTHLLAFAASSHSGEERHQQATREILAMAGRSADDLQNTPDLPYGIDVAERYLRAGGERTRLAQNCSGKHAAMLLTCVINSWPLDRYLEPNHPLQSAIATMIATETGEPIDHVGVDGCGAPAHACSLSGLARAYGRSRVGAPTADVADAMLAFPEMVGGETRDVTQLMRALPGVLVKDGADGIMAAALPDGTGIAVKIADGAPRPRVAVLLRVLEMLGLDVGSARDHVPLPVLGWGRPVGEIRSVL